MASNLTADYFKCDTNDAEIAQIYFDKIVKFRNQMLPDNIINSVFGGADNYTAIRIMIYFVVLTLQIQFPDLKKIIDPVTGEDIN